MVRVITTLTVSEGSTAESLTLTFSEAVTETEATAIQDVTVGSIAVSDEGMELAITVTDIEEPIMVEFFLTVSRFIILLKH